MISQYIDDMYDKRDNPLLAFKENYEIIENLELITSGEGIFSSTASGVGKAAGAVGKGGFKATVSAGKAANRWVDDNILKGPVGSTIKFQKQRLGTMFKTIIDQILRMIDNLYQAIMGMEKRLGRMINDINQALTNRHPSGKFPDRGDKIITVSGLQKIGLDVSSAGSRASIAANYLEAVTKRSLLEGIHFGDEVSCKKSIEDLVERITGKRRPYESITREDFRKDIENNLYLFEEMNKAVASKSANKASKGVKDMFSKVFNGKQAASLASQATDKAKEMVPGNELANQSEEALKLLKQTAEVFVKLKAIEFLKKENNHLKDIGNQIDKLLAKVLNEESKRKTTSAQSYFDKNLFKEIQRAGFAEAGNPADAVPEEKMPKQNYDEESYPSGDEMRKDHELIQVFLVEYSKALNDTIQNISSFFEALLTAGKTTLGEYYRVTE